MLCHNYKRAFANRSKKWDNRSPATLIPQDGHDTEGVAVKMTAEEISRLDPFEGFPNWYNRVPVLMTNVITKE